MLGRLKWFFPLLLLMSFCDLDPLLTPCLAVSKVEDRGQQPQNKISGEDRVRMAAFRDRIFSLDDSVAASVNDFMVKYKAAEVGRVNVKGLYEAASEAKMAYGYAMEATVRIEVPGGLPDELSTGLLRALSMLYLNYQERQDAYEAFMNFMENQDQSELMRYNISLEKAENYSYLCGLMLGEALTKAGVSPLDQRRQKRGKR